MHLKIWLKQWPLSKKGKPFIKQQSWQVCQDKHWHDRFTGRVIDPVVFGGQTIFTKEEEHGLVDHVKTMSKFGYGYSRSQLIYLASDMAEFLHRRSARKPLSEKWLTGFLRRWPELKVTKPSSLSMTRAATITPEVVCSYYQELEQVITKYGLRDRPEAIYNLDETGFSPEHHPPKVLCMFSWNLNCITRHIMGIKVI